MSVCVDCGQAITYHFPCPAGRGLLAATPDALREAAQVVSEQAEDEGLWFIAQTAPEAYLQQELRRLHAAIEGDPMLIAALRAALEAKP